MADLMDLVVKLTLDDSEVSKGITDLKNNVAGKVGGVVGGAAKAAVAATAAASTALVGFTGTAVKAGAEFDQSMSQVAATMGKTTEEITDLRDFAQEMGASTSFSATQSADALNYMALAGYDAETAMGMLPNVLNLAAAGSMDLAQASDMITDTQSALGLSLEETTSLVDKMAKASSSSNLSVEQLGSALLTVGGTAKAMKGGTTEMATALGILADNGTKGAEGGTALRNVLLGLQSDKFRKTFGELGISAYDASGKMRSMKDILSDMNTVMADMTDEEKTQIITKTFNKADLKNVNALLATSVDRWDELSGKIDDSAGAAEKMANTQLDNLAGDVTLFKSALEGLQIAISDKVTPVLREFVKFGGEGLQRLTKAFKENGLDGAMEELGKILSEGVNKLVEGAPKLVKAAGKLLKAFAKGLMDNIDVILFAAGDIIEEFLKGMVDATSGGNNVILEIIEWIVGIFGENYMQFIDMGAQILLNILNGISENLDVIIDYVSQIITHFIEVFAEYAPQIVKASIAILEALVQGISDNLDELVPAAVELITGLINAVLENLDDIIVLAVKLVVALADAIIESRDELLKSGPELISALIEGITGAFGQFDQLGADTINKFIDAIQTYLPNLLPPGVDFIVNIIQGIVSAFDQLFGAGNQAVDEFGNAIESGATSKAETWGIHLMDAFIAGIKKRHPILSKVVEGVAGTVRNLMGHSHPKEGPMAEDYKWMPDMMDLFIKGINDGKGDLQAAFTEAVDFSQPVLEYAGGYGMIGESGLLEANAGSDGSYDDVVTAITDALMDMQLVVNIGNKPVEALISTVQHKTTYRSGGR